MSAERVPLADFTPGHLLGLPAEAYHVTHAMSASGAKKILRSPQHFKVWRDTPQEPTEAMQFGTAVHTGVLEPDTLASRVLCVPSDAPKRPTSAQLKAKKPAPETIEVIEWWQDFNRRSLGKLVLAAEAHARATACIEAVNAHPAAQNLLQGAQTEGSLFWYDGKYGVPCKARYDARNHGGLIDLKTCQDASPEAFGRQAASLLYHVQAAHYMSGAEHVLDATPQFFAFICVESEPPHAVACYVMDGSAVMAGSRLMNKALERYKAALDTGKWSGYPASINRLPFPRWALSFQE